MVEWWKQMKLGRRHREVTKRLLVWLVGKSRVKVVAQQRWKLRDMKNADVLDRLNGLHQDFDSSDITWHRSCYSSFTSESKLERLRKQRLAALEDDTCDSKSVPTGRSATTIINWNLCMFCQTRTDKKLHRVETNQKSASIIKYA